MSTLEVSNLNDGTTTVATTYITNGSSMAWCSWNGESTVAIRDSLNMSSVTDIGTGEYHPILSSAMSEAENPLVVTGKTNGTSNSGNAFTSYMATASQNYAKTYEDGTARDCGVICVDIKGTLA